MVFVEDVQDGTGYFAFIFIIGVDPYLHFSFADGHEADGQS
jgi:hypothetical protein